MFGVQRDGRNGVVSSFSKGEQTRTGSSKLNANALCPVFGCKMQCGKLQTTAAKILFLTYLFVVATLFLASKLLALLLWEIERENSHLRSFPFYGSSSSPLKASISTSKRCSTN